MDMFSNELHKCKECYEWFDPIFLTDGLCVNCRRKYIIDEPSQNKHVMLINGMLLKLDKGGK